jgi:hypothetical protein
VKQIRMLGLVATTFAVLALSSVPVARVSATSAPTTVSAVTTTSTAPATQAVSTTTRSVSQTVMTAQQLDATVGENWFGDFLEGMKDGMIAAGIFVIIIVLAG